MDYAFKFFLGIVAFFASQLQTFAQGPPSNSDTLPSQASATTAGPLFVTPSRVVIPGKDLEPRMVFVTAGGAATRLDWTIGQPTTSDGTRVLPTNSIVVNSNDTNSLILEKGRPTPVNFQILSSNAHSGEYTGNIYFYTTNSSATVQVVVQLKDDWGLPVLTLVFGIALSLGLTLYANSGRKHDELILSASRLERNITGDSGFEVAVEYRDALLGKLKVASNQINNQAYAEASAQLDGGNKMMENWILNRTTWLRLFERLNNLRSQAAGMVDKPTVRTALDNANMAAANSADFPPSTFATAIAQLENAINAARVAAPAAAPVSTIAAIVNPITVTQARWRTRLYTYSSYAVVLILLFVVGYQQLYDSKPIFGSSGLADYLLLFLWGFGTETVTRASINTVAKNIGISGFP